jgi:nucleotide-binding universal stress UspA family protein
MNRSKGPIVIPVDGSPVAEQALLLARYLTRQLRRPILLAYPLMVAGDFSAPAIRDAWAYVERLGRQLIADGVGCEATVAAGDTAAALLELAEDSGASGIVLAGCFASQSSPAEVGTLAHQLLQRAPVPVLIQTSGAWVAASDLVDVSRSIIVRKSSASEAGADPTVAKLSTRPHWRGRRSLQAPEPPSPAWAPATSSQLVELTAEEAVAYLKGAA